MIPCIIIINILKCNDTVLNRTKHKAYLNGGTVEHQLVVY